MNNSHYKKTWWNVGHKKTPVLCLFKSAAITVKRCLSLQSKVLKNMKFSSARERAGEIDMSLSFELRLFTLNNHNASRFTMASLLMKQTFVLARVSDISPPSPHSRILLQHIVLKALRHYNRCIYDNFLHWTKLLEAKLKLIAEIHLNSLIMKCRKILIFLLIILWIKLILNKVRTNGLLYPT